ncbi:MAG: hypothetical protein K6B64_00040 [Acholeplasmatales bacterium]|nr:hypothetical protein [Acholeplasmatales bacterium]
MKRILGVGLAILSIFTLASCNNELLDGSRFDVGIYESMDRQPLNQTEYDYYQYISNAATFALENVPSKYCSYVEQQQNTLNSKIYKRAYDFNTCNCMIYFEPASSDSGHVTEYTRIIYQDSRCYIISRITRDGFDEANGTLNVYWVNHSSYTLGIPGNDIDYFIEYYKSALHSNSVMVAKNGFFASHDSAGMGKITCYFENLLPKYQKIEFLNGGYYYTKWDFYDHDIVDTNLDNYTDGVLYNGEINFVVYDSLYQQLPYEFIVDNIK